MDWREWRAVAKAGGFVAIDVVACEGGWSVLGTDHKGKGFELNTRRGDRRYFSSLDTAASTLADLGIRSFGVGQHRNAGDLFGQ
jgi:hypothetical protein